MDVDFMMSDSLEAVRPKLNIPKSIEEAANAVDEMFNAVLQNAGSTSLWSASTKRQPADYTCTVPTADDSGEDSGDEQDEVQDRRDDEEEDGEEDTDGMESPARGPVYQHGPKPV
jgi:regulator of nonsense transcripts 2